MRLLFDIDTKDYDKDGRKLVRDAARSIIIRDGKIALVHSLKYAYYKFPGGGIEDGESRLDALARETLEEAGLVVDTAENGELAVKAVKKNGTDYYDFILMDIQMPVIDGYEATKAIRALPGGDKAIIIALSANAFEEDVQKSLSTGMNAHIAKPIDVNALFDTMKNLTR